MPLFEKGKQITRKEFREKLRKAPFSISGTTKKYYRKERIGLEKEFGKIYGSHISKQEFRKRLWKLEKERFKAKSSAEKTEIRDKINYLKKLEKS